MKNETKITLLINEDLNKNLNIIKIKFPLHKLNFNECKEFAELLVKNKKAYYELSDGTIIKDNLNNYLLKKGTTYKIKLNDEYFKK